jgi:hypothetical protein
VAVAAGETASVPAPTRAGVAPGCGETEPGAATEVADTLPAAAWDDPLGWAVCPCTPPPAGVGIGCVDAGVAPSTAVSTLPAGGVAATSAAGEPTPPNGTPEEATTSPPAPACGAPDVEDPAPGTAETGVPETTGASEVWITVD